LQNASTPVNRLTVNRLTLLVSKSPMRRRKPSIKDVAALAGVSTATVSNVFSGRKPVNVDLQKSVQKAAKSLGYQVDRAASHLRSGRTRVIAVLVPDLTDTFFATIVTGLETMAYEQGYDVIVASSRNERSVERSRMRALLAWRPAGFIVVPCSKDIPAELIAIRDEIPMVLVDRVATKNAIADTVTINNRDAGEVAARHLLELGHKDIVLAVSDLSFPPIKERSEGASSLIKKYIGRKPTVLELSSDNERGSRIFASWLERSEIPSAVIAFTNVTSLSVLSALVDHKIEIPERTSMVAFDDYAWMAARKTGLTAIRQPAGEIAAAAWIRLMFRIENGNGAGPYATILSTSLVVRASVRDLSKLGPKIENSRETLHPVTLVSPEIPIAGEKKIH
jgi:DNA-binding LacI/PurR family transcriptional regulator